MSKRLAARARHLAQVVADPPDNNHASVEPQAHLAGRPMGRTELRVVLGETAAEPQGGQDGASGMVFMGHRGAKQGHKAIAEKLIDGALIAVHLIERQGKEVVQQGMVAQHFDLLHKE